MTPTTKTDILIFLKNKKLLAGTIHIRYLIYLKATYGQKTKESDFSTLATKLRFWSIFPDRRSLIRKIFYRWSKETSLTGFFFSVNHCWFQKMITSNLVLRGITIHSRAFVFIRLLRLIWKQTNKHKNKIALTEFFCRAERILSNSWTFFSICDLSGWVNSLRWYNPQKINIFPYVVLQKVIYVTWNDT